MRTIINKKNIFQVLIVLTVLVGIFSYVFINNTKILKAIESSDNLDGQIDVLFSADVQYEDGDYFHNWSYDFDAVCQSSELNPNASGEFLIFNTTNPTVGGTSYDQPYNSSALIRTSSAFDTTISPGQSIGYVLTSESNSIYGTGIFIYVSIADDFLIQENSSYHINDRYADKTMSEIYGDAFGVYYITEPGGQPQLWAKEKLYDYYLETELDTPWEIEKDWRNDERIELSFTLMPTNSNYVGNQNENSNSNSTDNYTVNIYYKMMDIQGNYPDEYTLLTDSSDYYNIQRDISGTYTDVDATSVIPTDKLLIDYPKFQRDFGDYEIYRDDVITIDINSSGSDDTITLFENGFNNDKLYSSYPIYSTMPTVTTSKDDSNNAINVYMEIPRQQMHVFFAQVNDFDSENISQIQITWDGVYLLDYSNTTSKTKLPIGSVKKSDCLDTINCTNSNLYTTDQLNSTEINPALTCGNFSSTGLHITTYAGTTITLTHTKNSYYSGKNILYDDEFKLVGYDIARTHTYLKSSTAGNLESEKLISEYYRGEYDSFSNKITAHYSEGDYYPYDIILFGVKDTNPKRDWDVNVYYKLQDINGNYPTEYTLMDNTNNYYYFQRQSGSTWNTIEDTAILPGDRVAINYSKIQTDFANFEIPTESDAYMNFATNGACSLNFSSLPSSPFSDIKPANSTEYSVTKDSTTKTINIYFVIKRKQIPVLITQMKYFEDADPSSSGPFIKATWDGKLIKYGTTSNPTITYQLQQEHVSTTNCSNFKSDNSTKYGTTVINSDENTPILGYSFYNLGYTVYAGSTISLSLTDSTNTVDGYDGYGLINYGLVQVRQNPVNNSSKTYNINKITSELTEDIIDPEISVQINPTYNASYSYYMLCYGVTEMPEQTYNISYDLNDISDSYDVITETLPETANTNETVTIPNPTLKGYTFTGWIVNDTDTVIYNASGVYDNLNDTTDAITLTANWESIEVQVGFVLDTQPYYIYTMNGYNNNDFKDKYMGVVEYDGSKYIDIATDTSYNGESFIDSDKVFIKGFDMVNVDVNTILEDNDTFMSYINDVDVDGDLTEKYINPGYKITGYYIITDSDIKTAFNHKTGYTAPYISNDTIDINEKIIDIIEDCETNETIYITPKWESYKYKVDIYYSYQDVDGNWTSYYNMTDYQIFGDKYYMDSEFIDYDPTKLISEGSNNIINVGQSITGDFSEINDWENMYALNRNYGAGINISQRFFMNPKSGGYLPKSYTGVPPEDKPFQDLYYYGLDGYYLSHPANSSVCYATVQRTKNLSGVIVLDETKCKKTKVNNENYDFEIKVYFRFPRDTTYVDLIFIPENTVNEGEHLYTPYHISYDKNGTHYEYRVSYDTGYYNTYKDENGNDLRFDATRSVGLTIYKGGSLELTNISVDNNHTYIGWKFYNTGPMANMDISQLTLGDSIDLGTVESIQVGNTIYMPAIYIKAESHTENTYSLDIDGTHYDLSNIVCDGTGINKIVVDGVTLWEHQCSVCGKTLLPNCALDSTTCLGNYILDTYTISDYTYNGGSYPYWSVNAHLTYQCALCNSTYEKDQAMSIYKMNISVSNNPTDEELRAAFSGYIERYYNSTYIEHEIAN